MTMLLDDRLRDLATQTHLLEKKVDALGWQAAIDLCIAIEQTINETEEDK